MIVYSRWLLLMGKSMLHICTDSCVKRPILPTGPSDASLCCLSWWLKDTMSSCAPGRLCHPLRTSTIRTTLALLPLATVCIFSVVDAVIKLADLILWKANGRKLRQCQFQSLVPVVLLLKRRFLLPLPVASNVKCTRFPLMYGIPFQVWTLPEFLRVVWCVLTKQFM